MNKVFEKLAKYREDKEGENKLMEPIEQVRYPLSSPSLPSARRLS